MCAFAWAACSSGAGGDATTAATSTSTSSSAGVGGSAGLGGSSSSSSGSTSGSSGGGGGDAGFADVFQPPPSACGADDETITTVSKSWGPAWSPPDPSKILSGWPLDARYELWWVPMPAAATGILAYRIEVPTDFDATIDPNPTGQLGYVTTAESPSTAVAAYEYALSETACDFAHAVPIQSDAPPYGPSANVAHDSNQNAITVQLQVRPKGMSHCVHLAGGGYYAPCLEPGHTYWWNLRFVAGGCPMGATCQPMIQVQRPKQTVDPNY